MTTPDNINVAAQKTVDYLYKIEGDCSPELYQVIDRLRQLINEEFVGKNKSVSSQVIYDILNPKLHKLLVAERIKGELKGFDKAFDSHDYDGLRKYRAELQAQLTQVGDE